MKKVLALSLMLVLAFAVSAVGQTYAPGSFSGFSDVQQFAQWTAKSTNSVASGAGTMQLDTCYFALAEGPTYWFPLAVNVKVKVIDSAGNSETDTITAVSTPTPSVGSAQPGFACAFTATFSNAHSAGVRIVSADGGLGEAIAALTGQGGTVAVTPNSGVTTAMITGVNLGATNVAVLDISGANGVGVLNYTYNGTSYALSSGGVPLLTGRCKGAIGSAITAGLTGIDPAQATIACTTAFTVATGAGTVMTRAGTLKNLVVSASAAGTNSSSGAATINKNGAASALTCTTGVAAACTDITHSVTFVAGDIISASITGQASETLADVVLSVSEF